MRRPNIAIFSLFRDSAGAYIEQYRQQVNALDYPPENIRLYLGEGDSVDNTFNELTEWAAQDARVNVIKHDTGQPYLGHTTNPARMDTLAKGANPVWDAIAADGWAEYALMLESDLIIKPDVIKALLLSNPAADIVAPMIWLTWGDGARFYDVWAYREDGKFFQANNPAWYASRYTEPFSIDSAGSVLLIKADVLRQGARFSHTEAVVGLCQQARGMGKTIYCDPNVHVYHPSR